MHTPLNTPEHPFFEVTCEGADDNGDEIITVEMDSKSHDILTAKAQDLGLSLEDYLTEVFKKSLENAIETRKNHPDTPDASAT